MLFIVPLQLLQGHTVRQVEFGPQLRFALHHLLQTIQFADGAQKSGHFRGVRLAADRIELLDSRRFDEIRVG